MQIPQSTMSETEASSEMEELLDEEWKYYTQERVGGDGMADSLKKAKTKLSIYDEIYQAGGPFSTYLEGRGATPAELKHPDQLDLSSPTETKVMRSIISDLQTYRRSVELDLEHWLVIHYGETSRRARGAAKEVVEYVLKRLALAAPDHVLLVDDRVINGRKGTSSLADAILKLQPSGKANRVLGLEQLLSIFFDNHIAFAPAFKRAAEVDQDLEISTIVATAKSPKDATGSRWIYVVQTESEDRQYYFGASPAGPSSVKSLGTHSAHPELDRAKELRTELKVSVIGNLPLTTPAAALYAIKSVLIACTGAYKPDYKFQRPSIGPSFTPGLPVKYIRTASMRYLHALRWSGESGRRDVPSLAMHRPGVVASTEAQKRYRAAANEYYNDLFGDLCKSARLPVDDFVTVLFFGGAFIRRLTDAVEAEHPLHPLGHALLPVDAVGTAPRRVVSKPNSLLECLGEMKISNGEHQESPTSTFEAKTTSRELSSEESDGDLEIVMTPSSCLSVSASISSLTFGKHSP